MSQITQLQQEIQFTEEYRWVLEAMKQVAASELRGMERQRIDQTALKRELQQASEILAAAQPLSVLFQEKDIPAGALVITSDAGFVGDLNVRIVRAAMAQCTPGQETLSVIGGQGGQIMKEQSCRFTECATLAEARTAHRKIETAMDQMIRKYRAGQIGRVLLVYPAYRSMGRQDVTVETLLPLRSLPSAEKKAMSREIILEAPIAEIEHELARAWIQMWMKDAIWNTKISELAARVVHLEGALDELGRQKRAAVLQYFRAMHEEMDRGIREIYASQLFVSRPRPMTVSGAP